METAATQVAVEPVEPVDTELLLIFLFHRAHLLQSLLVVVEPVVQVVL